MHDAADARRRRVLIDLPISRLREHRIHDVGAGARVPDHDRAVARAIERVARIPNGSERVIHVNRDQAIL